MSNVLPLDSQKRIWGLFRARFIVLASLILIVLALFAEFALLPSYIALKAAAPEAQQDAVQESALDVAEIMQAQALVATLKPLADATTTPSALVAAALALRPSGVYVDHVIYSSANKGTIMLVGTASTRDRLNAYKTALVKDGRFKNVSVPVADLIGAEQGRYSLTITGPF